MVSVTGWQQTLDLHYDWTKSMIQHGAILFSNHTIASIFNYYTGWNADLISQYFFLIFALIIYSAFILFNKKALAIAQEDKLVVFYFTLLALIPNVLITDTEHFLFSFPVILMSLHFLSHSRKIVHIVIFCMCVLLYGANTPEFFGNELSDKFEVMGFLGIGNLCLIIFFNYLFFFSECKENFKHSIS